MGTPHAVIVADSTLAEDHRCPSAEDLDVRPSDEFAHDNAGAIARKRGAGVDYLCLLLFLGGLSVYFLSIAVFASFTGVAIGIAAIVFSATIYAASRVRVPAPIQPTEIEPMGPLSAAFPAKRLRFEGIEADFMSTRNATGSEDIPETSDTEPALDFTPDGVPRFSSQSEARRQVVVPN